ncbi:MAG TPA: hypothetical protein DET40_03990 [Lentisphaeria bacterium]|nr:MAG: hypothetical protein A2X45_15215 [Lentisphaerae bacterium GWF2_50_93]HCE42687.1 hypothetical protein [Lentisphaeria bacterium]
MKRHFTLIELLVVIAIIAVLIAILLPALKSAKEIAMKTVCVSQQRQVYLNIVNYSIDHDNYVVPTYYSGFSAASNDMFWTKRLNNLYPMTRNVYLCPSDKSTQLFDWQRTYGLVHVNGAAPGNGWDIRQETNSDIYGPWTFTKWTDPRRPTKLMLADSERSRDDRSFHVQEYYINMKGPFNHPYLQHIMKACTISTDGSGGSAGRTDLLNQGFDEVSWPGNL